MFEIWPTRLIEVGAALLVAGLGGFLLGRGGRGALHARLRKLESEAARNSTQSRDQIRMVARMRGEQSTVASLVRFLPSVVRELNRSDLDPRRVPTLVVQLATAIFDADQVLLFLVRSPGHEGGRAKELFLRAHRGLGLVPKEVTRVRFGEGKIGWVAENKIEMASEDWTNLARTEGHNVEDNHPSYRVDLVGPLVHHSAVGGGEQLLGVLCLGGLKSKRTDDKLMLQTVTNLGSMALMNAHNLSQLREQANHDGLTGLLNKRQFMRDLGLMINSAEREAQSLGVFIFDIDYFKRYNDSHGHLAGDELLKTISRVLRDNIRPGDMACRYGGEEFVVALAETDGATAHKVAEKIREAVEAFPFAHGNAQPGGALTISGGVAAFPEDGTNGTELISHADQALYQAKADGRNRIVRYRGIDIGDTGTYGDPYDWPPGIVAGS